MNGPVLDSLYNMATTRNPVLVSYQQVLQGFKSLMNLQRNRRRAVTRLAQMNHRLQTVAVQVESPGRQATSRRMDCYR